MKFIQGDQACRAALETANAARSFASRPEVEAQVRDICEAVRLEGDSAVLRLVRQFDCSTLEASQLRVSSTEVEAAWQSLPANAQQALQRAADNIEAWHRAQPSGNTHTISPDGVFLGARYTPIERAGLYAPNARAALASSVLMLAIPAQVAGVRQVVLSTPAARDGSSHPVLLAAAKVAGIEEIYRVGGAVAMAAMAYGTPTIARVDKLVGPANIYGTLAKKQLFGIVGIDGLYGPSEVVVLCADDDLQQVPQLVADLIAQAEHGEDSFVCFICPFGEVCEAVAREVESQVAQSTRADYLRQSLAQSLILRPDSLAAACALCDLASPEHLEIWARDALSLSGQISHAGAIFLNTPVPLGDYVAGPSHTLPTSGTARFASGVGVDTFLKRTSLVAASPSSMAALADDLETIALLEDLPGHAQAVRRAANPNEP